MNRVRPVEGELNTFEWNIGNFQGREHYKSSTFQVDGYTLYIFASSFPSHFFEDTFWGFWLHPNTKYEFIYPIYYTTSIVDNKGQDFLAKKGTVQNLFHQRLLIFFNEGFLEENNIIQSGTLTLRVTLELNWKGLKEPDLHTASYTGAFDDSTQKKLSLPPSTKDCSTNTDRESSNLLETLSKDFGCFYECKKDTDCVLRVGEMQFPVHRSVLSARSPAFSAMFHHDTAENRSGKVDIPNVDGTTLKDVLYYVYSGKVRGLTEQSAASMYTIADKYELLELRTECLNFLKCNLSVENIGDAALLVHTHGETELEDIVIQFIEDSIEEVIESNQWREFSIMKPLLANKLLGSALVASKKRKVGKTF